MSNAVIIRETPAEVRARTIVYAEGWCSGTDARSVLGGDDFAEAFELCDPSGPQVDRVTATPPSPP
jgi:hypothetical protein